MKFPLALYLFGNNKDKLEKLNFIFRPLFASHSFQTIMMTQNSYFIFHIPFPFLHVLNIHLQSKHSDTWKILTKNIIGIFAGQQTATMTVWRKDSLNIHWETAISILLYSFHKLYFNLFHMSSVENIVTKYSDLLTSPWLRNDDTVAPS